MTGLDATALRVSLGRAAPAFGRLLAGSDPTTPVPGCPGWALTDLAEHLGVIHRWATQVLTSGAPADDPVPTGDPLVWYGDGWPPLMAALDDADLQAPCWGFGPPPRIAGFWARRMAHETAVHLADARQALGLDPGLSADLAADGIEELLTVFLAGRVRRGQCPPPAPAITLASPDGRWQVGEGDPAAVVHGPADALLLTLWRRRTLAGLDVEGDLAAATAVLALPLTS